MTDYKWGIGTGGEMMIRDTGTYVEFWITSNNSTSYSYDLPWGYTVNGVTDNSNEYRYEQNAGWERLGRWNVTTDQTVTFRLYDTGTGSMGSGETHSVAIDRTSAPPTPPAWGIEQIFDTSVQGDADGYPNGGLTIDQIQVRYDESSTAASPSYFDPGTDGYGTITGLARGTTYYFWQRTHNAKGWSPWSARTTAKTHNYPPAPSAPVLTNVTQSSVHAKISGNGDGGSPILEWRIGWSTNPAGPPTTWVSGWDIDISNLTPGAKIYFWGQGRNVYGWGALSAAGSATLLAGAYVDVAGVKKRAVPYVKVAGVWKVAEVRVNLKGLWTGTG
jgi:hypothetical protein